MSFLKVSLTSDSETEVPFEEACERASSLLVSGGEKNKKKNKNNKKGKKGKKREIFRPRKKKEMGNTGRTFVSLLVILRHFLF